MDLGPDKATITIAAAALLAGDFHEHGRNIDPNTVDNAIVVAREILAKVSKP